MVLTSGRCLMRKVRAGRSPVNDGGRVSGGKRAAAIPVFFVSEKAGSRASEVRSATTAGSAAGSVGGREAAVGDSRLSISSVALSPSFWAEINGLL